MNTFSDVRIKNLAIAVLAMLALFLALQSIATVTGIKEKKNIMPSNVITVRGTGEAIATPDIATFSFTVREEAKDVAAAQQTMSDKSNQAIDYLKKQGIEEKDIKTESYNTYPKYQYSGGTCFNGSCAPSKEILTGYEVSQTVSVKVRDVAKAGDLLTGIAGLKVGEVSSLSFTIDDIESLKIKAKEQAIEKARAEAVQIADALNVDLERVVGFYEEYPYDRPYDGYGGDMMRSSTKAENQAMIAAPIQTGEQKITATVSITYEIED